MGDPFYSPERRALRLVAESSLIEVHLKPETVTVNPVFELVGKPAIVSGVTIDGRLLGPDAYTWDGATLWVKGSFGASGAAIRLKLVPQHN